MGIAFVLLIWLIAWMVVACFCSLVFAAFTWWLLRRANGGPPLRAIVAVVLLPPVSVVCGLFGFVGYGVWCETSRGVDAGIGDSWGVPLGSGYQLRMIDTSEQAYVEAPTGEQFGHRLRRLGFDDHAVYFETAPDTFELIEKKSGQSSTGLSEAGLVAHLQSLGSPGVELQPPGRVYSTLRWEAKDLLVIPMVLGLPALLTIVVASYIWNLWRTAKKPREARLGA